MLVAEGGRGLTSGDAVGILTLFRARLHPKLYSIMTAMANKKYK